MVKYQSQLLLKKRGGGNDVINSKDPGKLRNRARLGDLDNSILPGRRNRRDSTDYVQKIEVVRGSGGCWI